MMDAAAPPADSPATYTRRGSTAYRFITSNAMPAISDGSPMLRRCWPSWNQLADRVCPGYTTSTVSRSASSFMRVPAAKSSGDCVQPCSITTSGIGVSGR